MAVLKGVDVLLVSGFQLCGGVEVLLLDAISAELVCLEYAFKALHVLLFLHSDLGACLLKVRPQALVLFDQPLDLADTLGGCPLDFL